MQMKYVVKNDVRKNHLLASEITSKKVDINVLLNKVKIEKKDAMKKKIIIFAGAVSSLIVTGLISTL